jgi:hypothetical protein
VVSVNYSESLHMTLMHERGGMFDSVVLCAANCAVGDHSKKAAVFADW